jgi:putative SOS response-associated peptidase YedK
MCGRYALKLLADVLELPFVEESEFPAIELPWTHFNVCPGTVAPIVDKHGVLRPALWGLIPHWSKEARPKRPLFNARLETAATRSSFRMAWSKQRCVVPASGFYEWSDLSGRRAPYFVPPEKDSSLLWLAGLASHFTAPDGETRWSYAILTEDSQGSTVEPYHDRRPVALTSAEITAWLHSEDPPGPRSKLGPPYMVSSKVNVAAVNEPSNLQPVAQEK